MRPLFFFLLVLFLGCKSDPSILDNTTPLLQSQKTLVTEKAAVASAHPLASKVGKDIMEAGGNAVDAAIAVQFALAVTFPLGGNIGGGGFMVIRWHDGTVDALDYREMAPKNAHRDMFLDEQGDFLDSLSRYGGLASGVPGSVAGMVEAHKKYGTMEFAKLVEPAIEIARDGFPVSEIQAKRFNKYRKDIIHNNRAPVAFVKADPWEAGDTLRQTDLANTLSAIALQGRDGFYTGPVAQYIVDEMKASNGIITLEDLQNYKAIWRKPITGHYRNHKVISMPPPSSGGIALMQLLESIENFRLDTMEQHSTAAVHLMVEAEKRVYADRAQHLGDSDFYPVPVQQLVDSAYIHSRLPVIPDVATPPGSVYAGKLFPEESEQTTHFSIVDPFGNAVATTTTINSIFGSKVVVQNGGFFMNNEMDDFSAKPGVPNQFGLLGNEANAIEPGKRMLSSMTPTILEKDGKWFLVVGSPGGSTIITSVFQTIVNVVEFDQSVTDAVAAKRFHNQWRPDSIFVEDGAFSATVTQELDSLGHHIVPRKKMGAVEAIHLRPDGKIEAAADPRWDDSADGF